MEFKTLQKNKENLLNNLNFENLLFYIKEDKENIKLLPYAEKNNLILSEQEMIFLLKEEPNSFSYSKQMQNNKTICLKALEIDYRNFNYLSIKEEKEILKLIKLQPKIIILIKEKNILNQLNLEVFENVFFKEHNSDFTNKYLIFNESLYNIFKEIINNYFDSISVLDFEKTLSLWLEKPNFNLSFLDKINLSKELIKIAKKNPDNYPFLSLEERNDVEFTLNALKQNIVYSKFIPKNMIEEKEILSLILENLNIVEFRFNILDLPLYSISQVLEYNPKLYKKIEEFKYIFTKKYKDEIEHFILIAKNKVLIEENKKEFEEINNSFVKKQLFKLKNSV